MSHSKKLFTILALLMLVLLFGIAYFYTTNTTKTAVKETTSNTTSITSIKERQRLQGVLFGKFTGTIPCADCDGIFTDLILNKNTEGGDGGLYELVEIYRGVTTEPKVTQGTWITITGTDKDENAVVYQLTPSGPDTPRYFKVLDENTLRLLDRSGNEINTTASLDITK